MNQQLAVKQTKEMVLLLEPFKMFDVKTYSDDQRAEVAHYLDQEIDMNMKAGLLYQLQAGWYLHVMKESGAWKGLGDHIKSWKDYVEKEKGISTGTDSFLRGIATELGPVLSREENEDLLNTDYKRLTEVLTLFRRNKDLLDAYVQKNKKHFLSPGADLDVSEAEELGFEIELEGEELGKLVEPETEAKTEAEVIDAQVVDEDVMKEVVLRNACTLPLKSWQSYVKEIRGEEVVPDACAHEGEVDILHRCRACGQLFAPSEGHSQHFTELQDKTNTELEFEHLKAIGEVYGQKAKDNTHSGWHKKKQKFVVCPFTVSDGGIYGTDMTGKEYSREGFINLIIEIRSVEKTKIDK